MQRLVDTDVFSYILKNDTRGYAYKKYLGRDACLSFITIGELFYWAEKRQWQAAARLRLRAKLSDFVILAYDERVARCYGRVRAELETQGVTLATNDLWIAATALAFDCELITHNARHFTKVSDLRVITVPQ